MSFLDPLSHVLAAIVAAAHAGLTALGAAPGSAATWVLCIAAVVVTVRVAVLPFALSGVRQAHAAARARPQLQELATRYRNRRDPESLRAFAEERRRIAVAHHLSPWGCLPVLVQMPIWWALYHLVTDVASGVPVGAMHAGLVASLGTATLLGVPLAARGYLGAGIPHFAVVAGLAGTAAALSYITQRFVVAPSTVLTDVPETMARIHGMVPAVSAVGMVVAGGVVPLALLVYWACNSAWTLGQTAVLRRWSATPRTPAATR